MQQCAFAPCRGQAAKAALSATASDVAAAEAALPACSTAGASLIAPVNASAAVGHGAPYCHHAHALALHLAGPAGSSRIPAAALVALAEGPPSDALRSMLGLEEADMLLGAARANILGIRKERARLLRCAALAAAGVAFTQVLH